MKFNFIQNFCITLYHDLFTMIKSLKFVLMITACLMWLPCLSSNTDDPHGTIVEQGTLYEQGLIPTCHAATIVQLPNGDMLAAYFAGSYEGHPDCCIYLSRRQSGHKTWDLPQMVVSGIRTPLTECAFDYDDGRDDQLSRNTRKRKPCYNPVLYWLPKGKKNGEIVLNYKIGKCVQDWTGWEVRSSDFGHTWTKPQPLQTDPTLHQTQLGPIKNKPLRLDGRIIAGSSTEKDDNWKIHFEFSDDGGRTWKLSYPKKDTLQCIQPAILTLKNGDLKAIGRTRHGRLFQCVSKDKGTTWGEVTLTDMPNNNSGIDAITIKDGRHLLVYNNSDKEGCRTPLSVAISDDSEHWKKICDLETDHLGEYSYPCVIQAKDGKVWILYTWRRLVPAYAIIDLDKL